MTFPSLILKYAILLPFFSCLLFPPSAISQIYKWTDENGNVHFADSPPPGVKVNKIQEEPSQSKNQGNPSASPEQRMAGKREYRDIQVTIYTASWCPYCKRAKEYLNSLNVKYMEYDVEKDKDKAAEFRSKGGNGVPLVDIEGIIIKGYSPSGIKAALESKRGK